MMWVALRWSSSAIFCEILSQFLVESIYNEKEIVNPRKYCFCSSVDLFGRVIVIIQWFLYVFPAEFIISLAEKNNTFESFKKVLVDNGAEFGVRIQDTVQILKIGTVCFLNSLSWLKEVDGMADSLHPDQAASCGAVWSGSGLSTQIYLY